MLLLLLMLPFALEFLINASDFLFSLDGTANDDDVALDDASDDNGWQSIILCIE